MAGGLNKYSYNRSVTLKDVALAANVSVITVSRALRKPELVSPGALDRVRAAVAALGYVPNPAARALASVRSMTLGVVIPSVTNSVFADLLSGILDSTEGTPYEVQFANTRYFSNREENILRLFATQRPAGMIVAGIDQSPAAREILQGMGCPVVQAMEIGPAPVDMIVGCDQRGAARAAVQHLIDVGYRKIGFLGARMDPRAQRRLRGYRDTLEQAGLFDPRLILTTPDPTAVSVGRRMLGDFLAQAPDADAIFCNNDDIALGALFEAQSRGMRVPMDLGIVGFNDLDIAGASEPSITSVRTDRYGMGRRAVEMLIGAASGTRPTPSVVDMGFQLERRDSTARRPQAKEKT